MLQQSEYKKLYTITEPVNLGNLPGPVRPSLERQFYDSERRIEIFERFKTRSELLLDNLDNAHLFNPLVLACATAIDTNTRLWICFVATYFGKSNLSGWTLAKSALFKDSTLLQYSIIVADTELYLASIDKANIFKECNFSNHRKYTAKRVYGPTGYEAAVTSFIVQFKSFVLGISKRSFDDVYNLALSIKGFGRMAAFDFACLTCKVGLNVEAPKSLYLRGATGPIEAMKLLFSMCGQHDMLNTNTLIKAGDELLSEFNQKLNIQMSAQVLEDALCNWQKSPVNYRHFSG